MAATRLRPSEINWKVAFGVLTRDSPLASISGPCGGSDAEEIEQGRHHVQRSDGCVDSPRREAGSSNQERYTDELVIQAVPVLSASVVSELLAVVGDQHDDRVVREPAALESLQERADRVIREGDLTVVESEIRIRPESLRDARVLAIPDMWIEVVEPQEEGPIIIPS